MMKQRITMLLCVCLPMGIAKCALALGRTVRVMWCCKTRMAMVFAMALTCVLMLPLVTTMIRRTKPVVKTRMTMVRAMMMKSRAVRMRRLVTTTAAPRATTVLVCSRQTAKCVRERPMARGQSLPRTLTSMAFAMDRITAAMLRLVTTSPRAH